MIPNFINIGASWEVLPAGIHDATLDEIKHRFAINKKRKELFSGLLRGCILLRKANCQSIFLDGSFVTAKLSPGDFDVCWDPVNVIVAKLDPVFLDFKDQRKLQKLKFHGEFFPSSFKADGTNTYLSFFQNDRETGLQKGIIHILF